VDEPTGGILRGDGGQGGEDGGKQVGTSAGLGFAKEGFDLAPHHLDRIEVRGVVRKEAHLGTDLLD